MNDTPQPDSADAAQEGPEALRARVIKALRSVRDPEIPVNIYDLGLIYDVSIDKAGAVSIRMTLTTPNCPVAEMIPVNVEKAVRSVQGVEDVAVELVWEPVWTTDLMTEAARLELEFTGHTSPAHFHKSSFTSLTTDHDKRDKRDKRDQSR